MDDKRVTWGTFALTLGVVAPILYYVDGQSLTSETASDPQQLDIITFVRSAYAGLPPLAWVALLATWLVGILLIGSGLRRRPSDAAAA